MKKLILMSMMGIVSYSIWVEASVIDFAKEIMNSRGYKIIQIYESQYVQRWKEKELYYVTGSYHTTLKGQIPRGYFDLFISKPEDRDKYDFEDVIIAGGDFPMLIQFVDVNGDKLKDFVGYRNYEPGAESRIYIGEVNENGQIQYREIYKTDRDYIFPFKFAGFKSPLFIESVEEDITGIVPTLCTDHDSDRIRQSRIIKRRMIEDFRAKIKGYEKIHASHGWNIEQQAFFNGKYFYRVHFLDFSTNQPVGIISTNQSVDVMDRLTSYIQWRIDFLKKVIKTVAISDSCKQELNDVITYFDQIKN